LVVRCCNNKRNKEKFRNQFRNCCGIAELKRKIVQKLDKIYDICLKDYQNRKSENLSEENILNLYNYAAQCLIELRNIEKQINFKSAFEEKKQRPKIKFDDEKKISPFLTKKWDIFED